jgi:5-methylcytosine-specific restriction endonuclease McrA
MAREQTVAYPFGFLSLSRSRWLFLAFRPVIRARISKSIRENFTTANHCLWYSQSMGRKRKTEPRICEVCGITFYKPLSHVQKWPARTCSRKCCAVLRVRAERRNCLHCGTPFMARRSAAKKGFALYCSNACNGLATQRRETVPCRWCSKDVSVTPWLKQTRKKHFCNRTCMDAWAKRFGTKKGVNAFSSEQKKRLLKSACERCNGTDRLELDHIVPRFAGGLATDDNAQTLCRKCNREKYWLEDAHKYDPDLSLRVRQ